MSESNVEAARRGFEAMLRGDLDVVTELLDPDVKWHGGDPTASGSCQNRDQALRFMRQSDVIRARKFELADVIDAGDDKVVVIIQPPSGPRVANVTTFRNGKVVEIVHYPNPDDALNAAGGTRTPTGEPTGS